MASIRIKDYRQLRTQKKKPPREPRGGFLNGFPKVLYLPTCRFTILGACDESLSEKTFRLTYSPSFNRPSACWRSAGVLIARGWPGYRTAVMTSSLNNLSSAGPPGITSDTMTPRTGAVILACAAISVLTGATEIPSAG